MLKSQREKRLRDRLPQVGRVDWIGRAPVKRGPIESCTEIQVCLLYTSDAADDLTRVDLGGRRIIKKKKSL